MDSGSFADATSVPPKKVGVTLFYERGGATFDTGSVLDLCLIYTNVRKAIHASTGMDADTFLDGVEQLLAPVETNGRRSA